MSHKDVGSRLFSWWLEPESAPEDLFAEDFVFDSGIPGFEDFVWWVQQKPPWTDVKLLETFDLENRSVVLFEGTDSATSLRHRVAWILYSDGGLISKLIETVATLNDEQA